MWLQHPDTTFIIQEAWSRGQSLTSKLKHTKTALKEWNKKVFGNIHLKLQQLCTLIEETQNQPPDDHNFQLEQAAAQALVELEKKEEVFWKERAKARWIEAGDSNTHFFHLTTLIHRRYNRVDYIKNLDNIWINDRQGIGDAFESHYSHIFASVHPDCQDFLQDLFHPVISRHINDELVQCPTRLEIQQTLFSMGHYKSPGPDGMTVTFYKHYWGTIHETVIQEVQDFFVHGRIKPAFNHTFLALIPKVKGAARVDQFRPIALCNVILKLITKVKAGRLRPHLDLLIHPSQAAFIPHRAINDNIIINHEVMRYMNAKKGATGYMAIKIDLAKAYDRVEWAVLRHLMSLMGFEEHFIKLVMECVSTARFSLLLN